jgi:hypothetical protein
VDTSHVTLLARVARELEAGEFRRDELLFRLVRLSACWSEDRLMTAPIMFEHELDPRGDASRVMETLGADLGSDEVDWSCFIDRRELSRAAEFEEVAIRIHGAEQARDCALLGHGLAAADQRSVRLVTNDERLRSSAVRTLDHLRATGRAPALEFMAIDSINMMRHLLTCGAISVEVFEAALRTEFIHIQEREGLSERTRTKKLDRLTRIARELSVDLPDPDIPFDDSEIWNIFLGKVDDDGS